MNDWPAGGRDECECCRSDPSIINATRSALPVWFKTVENDVRENGVTINIMLPERIATHGIMHSHTEETARSGATVEETVKRMGTIGFC